MHSVKDRVAVVTGGGSGIGAALCRLFARAEMRVVVADIEIEPARTVADTLMKQGHQALAAHVDITSDHSLAALVDQVERQWGRCDLLCANAGVMALGRLATLERKDWEWVLSVNVLGTVQTVQHFLPLLQQAKHSGHIVITSSMAGLLAAGPYKGAYNLTKHALMAYGETLREELHEQGIGVSMLLPAGVHSRIAQSERNRPAVMGQSQPLSEADFEGLVAGVGNDVPVDADFAVRNVLRDIAANRPWIITHVSNQRSLIEKRFNAILQAFDAAQSPGA